MKINKRGSILLHVMVTGALMALIAATLMRMSLLRAGMGGRGAKMLAEKRSDQGALANALATWNAGNGGAGAVCSGNPPGYGGTCNNNSACNCSCSSGSQVITAAMVGGVCTVTLTSPDLQ